MSNKLKEPFGIDNRYKDECLTDKDPCDECPIYQERINRTRCGNIAERQYDEDCLCLEPCMERLTWETECLSKLAWLENKISKGEVTINE